MNKHIIRCNTCEYLQAYFKKDKNGFFVIIQRGLCELTGKECLTHYPACEKHKAKRKPEVWDEKC